jgi:hypothetical protein
MKTELSPGYVAWLENSGPFIVGTRCPLHERALRVWHRLGKLDCPVRDCPYIEVHACERDGALCTCDSFDVDSNEKAPEREEIEVEETKAERVLGAASRFFVHADLEHASKSYIASVLYSAFWETMRLRRLLEAAISSHGTECKCRACEYVSMLADRQPSTPAPVNPNEEAP